MNEKVITLVSAYDHSTNSVLAGFESRWVRREDAEIIYLSSFDGCNQACRMCHLTQQKQTNMNPATIQDFLKQASLSLDAMAFQRSADTTESIKTLHFNFMARGEPMLNPVIRNQFDELAEQLIALVRTKVAGITEIKFKISTIMPNFYEYDSEGRIVGGMTDLPFKKHKPEIYYSIYSTNPDFRKRWLPKAGDLQESLRLLANYDTNGGLVRFHMPLILGQNDDLIEIRNIVRSINYFALPKVFNLIRYNSPDETTSQETDEELRLDIKKYLESLDFSVQMVERVGVDVFASCGMFYKEQ